MARSIEFFAMKEDMLFIYDEVAKLGARIIYEDGTELPREAIDDDFVLDEDRRKRYKFDSFYIVNERSKLYYHCAEEGGRTFLSEYDPSSVGYLALRFGNWPKNGCREEGYLVYEKWVIEKGGGCYLQPEEYEKLYNSLRRKIMKEFKRSLDTPTPGGSIYKRYYMGSACHEVYKRGEYIPTDGFHELTF